MTNNYIIQTNPFVVPTDDGKTIREHFGHASVKGGDYSVAHMIAPSGWSEPYQTPEFDEITFVFKGKKMFKIGNEEIILEAGQSILIKKNTRIQYSNPFEEDCEYLSVCLPAFSPDLVHREEQ